MRSPLPVAGLFAAVVVGVVGGALLIASAVAAADATSGGLGVDVADAGPYEVVSFDADDDTFKVHLAAGPWQVGHHPAGGAPDGGGAAEGAGEIAFEDPDGRTVARVPLTPGRTRIELPEEATYTVRTQGQGRFILVEDRPPAPTCGEDRVDGQVGDAGSGGGGDRVGHFFEAVGGPVEVRMNASGPVELTLHHGDLTVARRFGPARQAACTCTLEGAVAYLVVENGSDGSVRFTVTGRLLEEGARVPGAGPAAALGVLVGCAWVVRGRRRAPDGRHPAEGGRGA